MHNKLPTHKVQNGCAKCETYDIGDTQMTIISILLDDGFWYPLSTFTHNTRQTQTNEAKLQQIADTSKMHEFIRDSETFTPYLKSIGAAK